MTRQKNLMILPNSVTSTIDLALHEGEKYCSNCQEMRVYSPNPLRSLYYVRTGIDDPVQPSDYMATCKLCRRRRASISYLEKRTLKPVIASEKLALDYLAERGIAALPARAVSFYGTDVVAWGCVRISVRYSQIHDFDQHFLFSISQRVERLREKNDVTMLICNWGNAVHTFHLFEFDHPIFFHADGRWKQGIAYMPDKNRRKARASNKPVLDDHLMAKAADALHLVEQKRLSWQERWQEMIAG